MATKQTKATLQGYSTVGQTEWRDAIESLYPGIDVTTEVGVVFINAGTNSVKKWNLSSALSPTSGSFVQTGYTTGSIVYHTSNNYWICTSDTPSTSTWLNLTALNTISDTDVDNITATLSVISGTDLKLLLESIDTALSVRPTSQPDSSDWIDDSGTTDTDKGWSNSKLYTDIGDALGSNNLNYIANGSSHETAIVALDTALGNLDPSKDDTSVNVSTLYSNMRKQDVTTGNDYYSFEGTSDFLPIYKDTRFSKVIVRYEAYVEDVGASSPGYISLMGGKLNEAGSALTGDSKFTQIKFVPATTFASGYYELEGQIANLDEGMNVLMLKIQCDSDNHDIHIRNVTISCE